jgi:hypothetical protein
MGITDQTGLSNKGAAMSSLKDREPVAFETPCSRVGINRTIRQADRANSGRSAFRPLMSSNDLELTQAPARARCKSEMVVPSWPAPKVGARVRGLRSGGRRLRSGGKRSGPPVGFMQKLGEGI